MSGSVRILVVDDESVTRLMVRRVLRDSGYEVLEAEDGQGAVTQCRDDPPDLVLMDVRMPLMNGFDACRAIRRLPTGLHMPVLMLTGLDDVMAVTLAFEAGATDFITKPINWALLGQRVRYALRTNRTERKLRESQQNLARAQRIARLAQWSMDLESGTCRCSDDMRDLLGLSQGPDIDMATILVMLPDDDRPTFEQFISRLLDSTGEQQAEVRVIGRDGAVRNVIWSGSVSLDAAGRPSALFGIVQDVSERRSVEARLTHQAHFDVVTGLPNQVLFRDRLCTAIAATRRGGAGFAVLELRTDAVRRLRESSGPVVANQALCAISRQLAGQLRERDTLSHLDGDRFTVLVSDVHGEVDAGTVAQRLVDAFAMPLVVGANEVLSAIHVGIALYPADGDDADMLLQRAGIAQSRSEAECSPSSGYRFFTPGIQDRVATVIATQVALYRGLERDEFELHFQPQVHVRDQRVVGVEALLRWRRPGLGLQMPDSFIPVLEQTGLIMDAGDWVLRNAIHEINRLPLTLAVNVSPRQLQDTNLANRLLRVVDELDFPPERLEIEVTEQAVLTDEERAFGALHDLASRGVRITLDDYGVGYSSLQRLKRLQRLPLHCLKIDRMFVTSLLQDGADAAIVRSTIELCHELGIQVVAEGVEDDSTLARLSDFGCDYAQGYGIGRPVPVDGLVDWFASSRFGGGI